MIFDVVTDDNFILYAAKHYDNPNCTSVTEFHNDLKRLRYIKRLINRYYNTKILKTKLLLNHIVILYNLFGVEVSTKLLFLKFDAHLYPIIKTFLLYLNYMPEKIVGIHNADFVLNSSDIAIDPYIAKELRKI